MRDKFNNSVGPLAHKSGGNSNKVPRALVAIMILTVGLQTATQTFAFEFQYHRLLGFNVFHIYPPWAIVGWVVTWEDAYPSYLLRAGNYGIIVAGVGLLLQMIIILVLDNSSKASPLYARIGTLGEPERPTLSGIIATTQKFKRMACGGKTAKMHRRFCRGLAG